MSIIIFFFLTSLCAFAQEEPSDVPTKAPPLNLVLIVVDDMSPDLGVYGNSVIRTPELDALAAAGTLFTHAYATAASCSASRSVILTGQHSHANGQYGHQHDFHEFKSWMQTRALPVLLSECGYRTLQVGKLHVAPEAVYHFDDYLEDTGRNVFAMAESCRPFLTETALAASTPQAAKPFFLYFAPRDPHRSRTTDPAFTPSLESGSLAPNLFGNLPGRAAHDESAEVFYRPEDVIVPAFLPDTPETRAELAQYYQSISRIDAGVGHLFSILRETGLWNSTVILFTSDHGMAFAGAKTNIYKSALHVPLIIRHPKFSLPGSREDAPVSFVDLTPTLLDIAGGYDPSKNSSIHPDSRKLPPLLHRENHGPQDLDPDTFHGTSFLPLIKTPGTNPSAQFARTYASHCFHEIQMYYPMRAVWDSEYKLIWNLAHELPFPFASDLWIASSWQAQWKKGPNAPYGLKTVHEYIHRPKYEFFHITNDPEETTNIAEDPAHAEKLQEYIDLLHAFQRDTADGWASKQHYE